MHFLNGPTPASFSFIFVLPNTHYIFYNKQDVKKCPSSIQCRDLNSRPLEHESPPITTGLYLRVHLFMTSLTGLKLGIFLQVHQRAILQLYLMTMPIPTAIVLPYLTDVMRFPKYKLAQKFFFDRITFLNSEPKQIFASRFR